MELECYSVDKEFFLDYLIGPSAMGSLNGP